MDKYEKILQAGLDEGIEEFRIPVAKRKNPIVLTFCPTDEGLVKRFPLFFENVQKAIDETREAKADVYGNGESESDIEVLNNFKDICIKEVDKLLDYEGNGEVLFSRCNPFRATKSGYWVEQVFYILSAIILKNAPDTMKACELNMSARGKAYAAKYLK